ncbi:hypothetical protein V1478_018312 [Vespula squamosa]|uniref:Uncharacterized protein n=1 Tax=Vespula squamosa TaxID=30214 RepID=A0ABD1ZV83_VESSQ
MPIYMILQRNICDCIQLGLGIKQIKCINRNSFLQNYIPKHIELGIPKTFKSIFLQILALFIRKIEH